jgi:pimeloyl-ACP methyl ester carboxylesterase
VIIRMSPPERGGQPRACGSRPSARETRDSMPVAISIFRSPEAETRFHAAYEAVLREWPVPYEALDVPTRFGRTRVVASGSRAAPPVILLPPGGGHAPIWVRNVGALSQSYRTYAVDIVGELNKSVPTRRIRSHREFMDWMSDLFGGLQIDRTDLVGNSNGGFYALETALYLPEHVRKVVLISPAATFLPMWAWWQHLLIPAHIIAPIVRSERMILKAYAWLWQGFPLDEPYASLRAISKTAGARYRPTINSVVPRVLRDEELRRIHCPVLLLIGDHEVIYDPEKVFRRATRLVAGLTAELIPNANHSAQFTAPDAVNARILEFLRE